MDKNFLAALQDAGQLDTFLWTITGSIVVWIGVEISLFIFLNKGSIISHLEFRWEVLKQATILVFIWDGLFLAIPGFLAYMAWINW